MIDLLGYDASRPIYLPDPVNRAHPVNHGLVTWCPAVPGLDGGRYLYDLAGLNAGVLTNMIAGFGWKGTTLPGGYAHLLFDGVDDHVDFGTTNKFNLTTGPFAVTAWVFTAGSPGSTDKNQPIFSRGEGTFNATFAILVYINATLNPGFQIYDGSVNPGITATAAVTANTWNHIGAVYDGANLNLYVNGISAAAPVSTAGFSNPSYSGKNAYVGRWAQDASRGYFNGGIDDLRVYGRGPSASEITAIYSLSRLGYPGVLNRIGDNPASGATTDVTLALTGLSLSVAQGSLGPSISKALTGQALTLAQGSLSPALAVALSGLGLTVGQGTLFAPQAGPPPTVTFSGGGRNFTHSGGGRNFGKSGGGRNTGHSGGGRARWQTHQPICTYLRSTTSFRRRWSRARERSPSPLCSSLLRTAPE